MPMTKEEKQRRKAQRAQVRAVAIEIAFLMATAGSKADRERAGAQALRRAADVLDEMAAGPHDD